MPDWPAAPDTYGEWFCVSVIAVIAVVVATVYVCWWFYTEIVDHNK